MLSKISNLRSVSQHLLVNHNITLVLVFGDFVDVSSHAVPITVILDVHIRPEHKLISLRDRADIAYLIPDMKLIIEDVAMLAS